MINWYEHRMIQCNDNDNEINKIGNGQQERCSSGKFRYDGIPKFGQIKRFTRPSDIRTNL